jgi:hypothetical protein
MATQIQTWQIKNGKLIEVNTSLSQNGRREKDDLEQWIKSNPEILGKDIAIIGEQVQTKSGPLDFLGIDNNGNTVIVELKREKLVREVIAQVIDYASDVANYNVDQLNDYCLKYSGKTLLEYLPERFPEKSIEDLVINKSQRLLLVGFAIDDKLTRIIDWLSTGYNLSINAIILSYIVTEGKEELLSKTVIIPEEIERENSNKKKFSIEMSDEPGSFDDETLRSSLFNYLANENMYSTQRLKSTFIPALLKNGIMSRDELRKEFVKTGAANDEGEAGKFLSLISNQLGYKYNDFLRQVINYEYHPTRNWEKNNFSIKDEYRQMVIDILDELKSQNITIELTTNGTEVN